MAGVDKRLLDVQLLFNQMVLREKGDVLLLIL